MKGIVIFLICLISVCLSKTAYYTQVSNDVSIGIFGADVNQTQFCLNPDCGGSSNQVINLFISGTCGNQSTDVFVEGNTTVIDFNITEFVSTVLSSKCGFASIIANSKQLFSSLPGKSAPKECLCNNIFYPLPSFLPSTLHQGRNQCHWGYWVSSKLQRNLQRKPSHFERLCPRNLHIGMLLSTYEWNLWGHSCSKEERSNNIFHQPLCELPSSFWWRRHCTLWELGA